MSVFHAEQLGDDLLDRPDVRQFAVGGRDLVQPRALRDGQVCLLHCEQGAVLLGRVHDPPAAVVQVPGATPPYLGGPCGGRGSSHASGGPRSGRGQDVADRGPGLELISIATICTRARHGSGRARSHERTAAHRRPSTKSSTAPVSRSVYIIDDGSIFTVGPPGSFTNRIERNRCSSTPSRRTATESGPYTAITVAATRGITQTRLVVLPTDASQHPSWRTTSPSHQQDTTLKAALRF